MAAASGSPTNPPSTKTSADGEEGGEGSGDGIVRHGGWLQCLRAYLRMMRQPNLGSNLDVGHKPYSLWWLRVKCRYCEENTPTSAVLCSRGRLRPLGTLNPCHSLAATATVGPSFLAAIAAAGFLHCADQLPVA